jgi:type IV secretory pathway VirB10-like protein
MKLTVLLIIIISLYLIYRIAFTSQPDTQRDNTPKPEFDTEGAVEKKRYVLPNRSNPTQTAATQEVNKKADKKAPTFAAVNEKREAAVPSEKLDRIFSGEPDIEDLDIEPDAEAESGTGEPVNADEESEDLRQTLGQDTEFAEGLSIEEMTEAVMATGNPTDGNAELLCKVEKTDMFEQLVSGDEGKAARIKAMIDRYMQSQNTEVESEENDGEWKDFDIGNYLS